MGYIMKDRVAYGGGGGSLIYPHLIIISDTGSTVTVTKGTTVLYPTETSTGHYECDLPEFGTYTIDAVLDEDDSQYIVNVDAVKVYTIDDTHFHGTITVTYSADATCRCYSTVTGENYYATESPYTFTVHHPVEYTIEAKIGSDIRTANVTMTTEGQSESVDVQHTPVGATVLPTDDIQIWLACAEIDKSYTTLAEVLADTDTYQLLLANSNACDYMARSTTWASAEGTVPVMTSDTQPSGTVIYSSVDANNPAYRAFDGNDDTHWSSAGGTSSDAYIGYIFTSAKCIIRADVLDCESAKRIRTFKIEGSNDGTNWTDVSGTLELTGSETKIKTFLFDNSNYYTQYRLHTLTTASNYNPLCAILQFYDEPDITTSETAMQLLGKYDYACDKLLSNATWAEAIANSDYVDSVLDISVPKMTSNTTPSGVADASANATNAWKAFDKDFTTYWNTTSLNNYVEYEFTTPIKLKVISFISDFSSASSYDRVKNFKVEAYNGNDWDVLITDTAEVTTSAVEQVFVCESNNTYTKFRFYIIDSYSGNNIGLIELQFYGRHASNYQEGKVAIHGARNATLYYKDSGSDITIGQTDSTTGIASVTLANIPTGTYAIYDGVAKDPSNLSNDYSKTVTITSNTTEVYLMPETTLYWYGNNIANISGEAYSFNTGNPAKAPTITFNTNSATISLIGSGNRGIAMSSQTYDLSDFSSMKSVAAITASTYTGYSLAYFDSTPTKTTPYTYYSQTLNDGGGTRTEQLFTKDMTSLTADMYCGFSFLSSGSVSTSGTVTLELKSLWLE